MLMEFANLASTNVSLRGIFWLYTSKDGSLRGIFWLYASKDLSDASLADLLDLVVLFITLCAFKIHWCLFSFSLSTSKLNHHLQLTRSTRVMFTCSNPNRYEWIMFLFSGHYKIARYLIDIGADVNRQVYFYLV